MNTEDIKILSEVESLLYEYPPGKLASAKDIQAAIQILVLKAQENIQIYGPWLAKAFVLNQQPDKALETIEKIQQPDRWCQIWKAASYSLKKDFDKMFESLKNAVQLDSETYSDVLGIKEFYAFLNNYDFLKVINLQPKPQLDEELHELANLLIQNQFFSAFEYARKLEKTHADQASIIDAAVQALAPIVEDIKEHGLANLAELWGKGQITPKEFESELLHFKLAQKHQSQNPSDLQKYMKWERR